MMSAVFRFLSSSIIIFFLLSASLSLSLSDAKSLRANGAFGSPDTVDSLDISKYLGTWYQVASNNLAIISTKQKDTYCSTALYGANGDDTISVHNYCTKSKPDGEAYTIDGYAYQTNKAEQPGQLKVKFSGKDAPPFAAPYWIL